MRGIQCERSARGRHRHVHLDLVEHGFRLVGLGVGLVVRVACAGASCRGRPSTWRPPPWRRRCRSGWSARALRDMKRSMPRISASPATGTSPTADSVAASTMKPLPVTPAAPLEVEQQHRQQGQLLRQRQRRVGGLRDEHRGHRQVDRGAVEVERVAGRDHQADGRLAARPGSPAWPSCAAAPTRTTRCRARSAALP